MLLVAAPSTFGATAGAAEVAAAMARAATAAGVECDVAPVAGGGEGMLEALGGTVRVTTVRGPLGAPVAAEWRMKADGTAVIETARASGLALARGPQGNDPLRATTAGTGELVAAALDGGATRVIVGAGGSAGTDGGLAALTALNPRRRLHAGIELVVACDVDTLFVDAAEVFAPEKGATQAQVALLRRRLERLVQVYRRDYGVDVGDVAGSGAGGGLAGGLAAAGALLADGFDVVAEALDLPERIAAADLVVTGEALVDGDSFDGGVVGRVVDLATAADVAVLVLAGDAVAAELPADLRRSVTVVSLEARFGRERALADPAGCVEDVVRTHLPARPA